MPRTPLPPSSPGTPAAITPVRWLAAAVVVQLGATALGFLLQTLLESELLANPYLSAATWQQLVKSLGGTVLPAPEMLLRASVPAGPVYGGVAMVVLLTWLGGAAILSRGATEGFAAIAIRWGVRGWRWWGLAAVWTAAWLGSLIGGWSGLSLYCARSSPLWLALMLNLWLAEGVALWREIRLIPPSENRDSPWPLRLVWIGVALYTVTFTAMNWGLWNNLQIPHGDSAMYEEHLWNLLHGKGFRSYLDQGLFLGEHLQVIHLLLLPLYCLWPSHVTLEFCESLALALTAVPVYCITRRHTGSPRAAAYLALASLLYFPLQYLDIAIDFKTFRPTALGIPVLLAAMDQMERRNWKWFGACLLLALSAQEDFAIPIAMLGFWLAATGDRRTVDSGGATTEAGETRRVRWWGAVVFVLSTAYLLLAVRVFIPWFRSGATVHYASYFAKFGETPLEILRNLLLKPGLLISELCDAPTFLYATYLLAPLAFLPCLSPARLALGLPLFGLLCLNELAQDPPGPFHHFHAPLLPFVLWAAAAGLGRLSSFSRRSGKTCMLPGAGSASVPARGSWNTAICGARMALGCALLSGTCYTLSPLGTRFWDAGRVVAARPTWWRVLYLPNERARAWDQVAALIPPTAHVASTDFVHPRLTHCERSYDYSRYLRKAAGYADRVPEDTDYIVLDLQHPYSESVLGAVRSAADVRELREEPERWELLTSPDDRYFVVLRRKSR